MSAAGSRSNIPKQFSRSICPHMFIVSFRSGTFVQLNTPIILSSLLTTTHMMKTSYLTSMIMFSFWVQRAETLKRYLVALPSEELYMPVTGMITASTICPLYLSHPSITTFLYSPGVLQQPGIAQGLKLKAFPVSLSPNISDSSSAPLIPQGCCP